MTSELNTGTKQEPVTHCRDDKELSFASETGLNKDIYQAAWSVKVGQYRTLSLRGS